MAAAFYEQIDNQALKHLRELYGRFSDPAVIRASTLDLVSRKDGQTRTFEADGIKDLLRYLPALLRIAEAHPDPEREHPQTLGDVLSEALGNAGPSVSRT